MNLEYWGTEQNPIAVMFGSSECNFDSGSRILRSASTVANRHRRFTDDIRISTLYRSFDNFPTFDEPQ